jgi:hypothetical protein
MPDLAEERRRFAPAAIRVPILAVSLPSMAATA